MCCLALLIIATEDEYSELGKKKNHLKMPVVLHSYTSPSKISKLFEEIDLQRL